MVESSRFILAPALCKSRSVRRLRNDQKKDVFSYAILYLNCHRDVARSIHYFTKLYQLQAQRISAQIDFHVEALNVIPALLNENQITSTPEAIIQSLDELLNVRPDIGEAWYVRGVIYGQ